MLEVVPIRVRMVCDRFPPRVVPPLATTVLAGEVRGTPVTGRVVDATIF